MQLRFWAFGDRGGRKKTGLGFLCAVGIALIIDRIKITSLEFKSLEHRLLESTISAASRLAAVMAPFQNPVTKISIQDCGLARESIQTLEQLNLRKLVLNLGSRHYAKWRMHLNPTISGLRSLKVRQGIAA